MIICSCNVLSDCQIRNAALQRPLPSVHRIYVCLGCSVRCGRCAPTIKQIVGQEAGKDIWNRCSVDKDAL
jgi:bacterioferritin-associated ferredoxin